MKYLYVRCNGGHYYRSGVACPFDGWSCDGLDRAIATFKELCDTSSEISIDALRKTGIASDVLERLTIVEFGLESAAFEALVAERYIHKGREVLAGEAGDTLL